MSTCTCIKKCTFGCVEQYRAGSDCIAVQCRTVRSEYLLLAFRFYKFCKTYIAINYTLNNMQKNSSRTVHVYVYVLEASFVVNRKEGSDQESIQLPNTFRRRFRRERRTHVKQRHHNQTTTSRKPKGQFLSQNIDHRAIQNKIYTRTYMQRYTMTKVVNHSRSVALERSE